MLDLSIAYSALRASQLAMDTAAHNIANADTPGYHRQLALFADKTPIEIQKLLLGTGVKLDRIQRVRSEILESAVTANLSEQNAATANLEMLRRIEVLLSPGSGSLQENVQTLFNELERLTAQPDDALQREIIVRTAARVADQVRSLSGGLQQLRMDVETEVAALVDNVNERSVEIADLNRRINLARGRGLQPNDLLDRRDQLVNELAELIDAEVMQQGETQTVVLLAGGTALIGQDPPGLELSHDEQGNLILLQAGFEGPLHLQSGRLTGLISAHNHTLSDSNQSVEAFAGALMQVFDGVQATGLGLSGPFESLRGERAVQDVAAPLNEAGTVFPVQSGELFVTVTDLATGQRQTVSLAIDPETDSLQDVATSVSGIDHLQGLVDSQTRTLQIVAEPGYAFDFAGRLDATPDVSAISGTARPALSGRFTGTANDTLTFEVTGGGDVGVTAGLTVEVRDVAGSLLATLDVGLGYEAGTALEVADGVQVAFGAGTLNVGDVFSTPVVAHPDTSHLLTALGLNTFFTGTGAASMDVHSLLEEAPERLAVARSEHSGDASNLLRLIETRDTQLVSLEARTPEQFLAWLTATAGDQVQTAQLVHDQVELLGQQLAAERSAYSGVDPNEEMVRLVQLQQAFQAAAKLITASNDMMQELLQTIR